MEIDRSTGDINDIPDIDLPASVTISNSENIFNFGLTSASQIQGKIEYSESPKPDFVQMSNKKDNKKRESIMLEISNGNQTYRKIIDVGENFDFTYLR